MILSSLVSLYDRLASHSATSAGISKRGFAPRAVTFEILLKSDGSFELNDLRVPTGTKGRLIAPDLLVPTFAGKRTSGIKPYFLCDKTSYLFGCLDPEEAPNKSRARDEFIAFKQLHQDARDSLRHSALERICAFLDSLDPNVPPQHPLWAEFWAKNGVFRIAGETRFVHEIPEVIDYWTASAAASAESSAMCLVTGKEAPIARVHPPIKGVIDPGGQAEKGIVNFNQSAFTSYRKEQSFNAPISELAAFKYITALNWLLDGPRPQRIKLSDATTVFWTGAPTVFENVFAAFLDGQMPDDETTVQDEPLRERLRAFFDVLRQGGGRDFGSLAADATTPFYVLGLSPNAARVSVRYWQADTLGSLVDNLRSHFDALRLVRMRPETEREFPTLYALLNQTAAVRKGKVDQATIPPLLTGPFLRAILTGTPYPATLASSILSRIRADHEVSYLRVALLKAFLIRSNHQLANLPMRLDTTRAEPGYRLGRLFAALEMTQLDALGLKLNATIRDRFYSAASATPAAVLPRLLRTYQHHLTKAAAERGQGMKVNREKLVQEILGGLPDIPAHLPLEGQCLFALGYYHQRQAFFAKSDESANAASAA